ncbi:MAG: hypothetical protein A2X46_04390 [Lentisphaerae bacterium GWF2_57_35]|nr:MAG: hypothetical protein A2X46_04390 [Lentisphaerae bacterium GWF2_57_35]
MALLEEAVEDRRFELGATAEGEGVLERLWVQLDYLKQGQFETAIRHLAVMVQRDNEPAAYLILAAAYLLEEEFDCALTILDILLHSDSDYAEAWRLKEWLCRRFPRCGGGQRFVGQRKAGLCV